MDPLCGQQAADAGCRILRIGKNARLVSQPKELGQMQQ
jgi:hypothetical protein